MRHEELDETRAEVARRRLAQLAAAFEAEMPHHGVEAPSERPVEVPPIAAVRPRVTAAHLRVVGVAAVAALVVLGWMLLSGRPQTSDAVAPVALASSGPSGGDEAAELVVDVVGAVKRPGIVTVPRGSRVHEAIEAAGGLAGKKVDTSGVNLARVLEDGEQIIVGPAPDGADGTAAGGKVRLNQATPEQLDTLPGVGPVTAAAIIAWRDENGRFSTVEDLLDVKGIGEATLAELRELVTP